MKIKELLMELEERTRAQEPAVSYELIIGDPLYSEPEQGELDEQE